MKLNDKQNLSIKKTFTFKGTAIFYLIMICFRRRGIYDCDMTLIFAISKENKISKMFRKIKKTMFTLFHLSEKRLILLVLIGESL